MLAIPMCLLYEAGLMLARLVAKRSKAESTEGEPDYKPLNDEEMDRELDRDDR